MSWNDDHNNQDESPRKNPWGKPQNDRPSQNNRPNWGQGSKGDDDLNFDQILRKIRQNFGDLLPDSNGGMGRLVALFVAIAAVLWLLSGIYFVQPNENGVVLTFGEYTRTDETPGIKWKVPWPFQTVEIVDVTTERRIHIGYSVGENNMGKVSLNSSHQESLMLTRDENIVDINFVVLWRIQSAKDYLYSIRDPEDTINMVAASTMREIIGQTNIQPALTDARTKIQSDARNLMQKLLDEYHAGVTINNVQLQKVDPPAAIVDAFNAVQRARQKKEELRNLAEAYRNDIIPRAKGDSEKLRQDADAYKQEVVSRATGDAKRFSNVYAAYKNSKDVTVERMYLETMESVLKNAKTVVLGNENSDVLPFLPIGDSRAVKNTTSSTTPDNKE
ncbi:MAG: FtsH protease activity modulator HflK [Alphaproteobacteria bacterium]|jgi:membrane protease subunit HflK|nr:FtsH protease activity modulator HflK [Alphaproteobacteria bacterium]